MKLTAKPASGSLPAHEWQKGFGVKLLRIMKLTTIIILAACLHSSANGLAQNTVTISGKEVSLEYVFNAIKKQTSYRFFFNTNTIQQTSKVTIDVKNAPIEQVMTLALKDQPLTFAIKGRTIFIMKKEERKTSYVDEPQPPIDVRGRVVNESGEPVEAVTVTVKGTKNSTLTNANGEFFMRGVDENSTLVFTSVNMETFEARVKGGLFVNVTLQTKITSMQEVVINKGYYTESRKFSTSNVGTVKATEIERQPVNNPLLALQGKVPGLVVTQASGLPGGGIQVRIQGQNSIANSSGPLYVIDGIPFSAMIPAPSGINFGPLGNSGESVIRGGSEGGTGSALGLINPLDIESIEILKDADATAIYGSRAANGAILITTKKGKGGKTRTSINVQQGWGKNTRKIDLLNTQQYLDMRYEALKNDGLIPTSNPSPTAPFTYTPDLTIWDTTRCTDWQKELIGGTSKYTNVNAQFSGGTQAIQYLFGGNFHKETTVFPGNFSDQRSSVHFNLNNNSAIQRFHFSLTASYLVDNNHLPIKDLTEEAIFLEPIAPPIYNSDGTLNWEPNSLGTSTWTNPMASMLYKTFEAKTNTLVTNANLSYEIIRGLKVNGNLGYTNMQSADIFQNALIAEKPEARPTTNRSAYFGNSNMNTLIIEPQVSYERKFRNDKLEMLIGTTYQKGISNGGYVLASGFNNDQVLKNLSAASSISSGGQFNNLYKYFGFYGRLNYVLNGRYIINITGRRDGSSRFGEKNQFHDFWSVGGGWIFTEEPTIREKTSFLTFGKLRANYGTSGSDQIGDYRFLSLYNSVPAGIAYQGNIGLVPLDIPNPYLAWEETRKLNMGISLGFGRDRITVNADYSHNRSSNQLLDYTLPLMTGRGSVLKNFPATVQNTSWEFSILSTNVKTENFNWSSNINVTIPKNELVDFPNLESSTYKNLLAVGQPLNVQRLFHFLGVDPATGVYVFSDKNGNPTSNPATDDRTVYLSTFQKFYGGFQNSFQFKSFQLDVLFQFVKQRGLNAAIFANPNGLAPGRFVAGFASGNQPVSVLNRWQNPGDISSIQRYTINNSNLSSRLNNARGSDANYEDASFIRLKNVSLSWEMPTKWKKKTHLQGSRLYISAQNLLTITNYTGLDPESQSTGSLPPLTVATIGIQLSM